MQKKTTAILFIADNKLNKWMASFDMWPQYKVFISAKYKVSFETSTLVDRNYWMNIIKKSKEKKDCWIPAIEHDGVLYVSPEIMELSDGNKIAVIRENAD